MAALTVCSLCWSRSTAMVGVVELHDGQLEAQEAADRRLRGAHLGVGHTQRAH